MKDGSNFRQYGASTSIWFHTTNPGLTAVYAAGFAAGTSQISKDGGAFVNTANLPTYVGNGLYNIILTAAEMQATYINLTFIAAASANAPVCVAIETKLIISQFFIGADTLPGANIGFEVRGGGGGGEAVKLWPTIANNNGMTIIGNGTGAGLAITGGATGIGVAIDAGASGATGLQVRGIAGNNAGVSLIGAGTGSGLLVTGGATGIGMAVNAGAGGAVGLQVSAVAGNNAGMSVLGSGTGAGLQATGGATNAPGIVGTGQGSGVGFNGISGTSNPSNFLSEVIEDITGPPVPGATTVRQGLAALVARFFYLVTQTSTQQKQYKSDSVTLVSTAAVSDDGVTQTKGKAS